MILTSLPSSDLSLLTPNQCSKIDGKNETDLSNMGIAKGGLNEVHEMYNKKAKL